MPSAPDWPLNRVGSHVLPATREGQPNRSTGLEPTAETFQRPEGGEESGQGKGGELAARMPG